MKMIITGQIHTVYSLNRMKIALKIIVVRVVNMQISYLRNIRANCKVLIIRLCITTKIWSDFVSIDD